QNHAFNDHYLDLDYDLTDVMFITTANTLKGIPVPLQDRMEIIQLGGYTEFEKLHIAQRYLLPRQVSDAGLDSVPLSVTEGAVRTIIHHYTKEAGVRNLEREIARLCRKVAREIAENGNGSRRSFQITPKNLEKYLGVAKYLPEEEMEKDYVGVATGLAWTEAGGDIIYIEATTMKGRGNLTLTGQLGEVMKESAQAAVSYVRSKAKRLGIKEDIFGRTDIHIHVPAGAIPKDGPSAGITMATAIASALTGKPVRKDVAMTGEVTLRGRVLPIGGLKEKAIAAKRMGIKTILIPKRNTKDLEELPEYITRDLAFVPVETMDEVLAKTLREKKKKTDRKRQAA
ncbi:MAG: endopeptidase La, partial [Nitrospiraceae bacterium]|nr:endopeptidase La [Nitrospiraceae bacterium]